MFVEASGQPTLAVGGPCGSPIPHTLYIPPGVPGTLCLQPSGRTLESSLLTSIRFGVRITAGEREKEKTLILKIRDRQRKVERERKL